MTGPLAVSLVSEHASPLATLGGVDAGGQNVHVAALACALADLGHQVVVHTRRDHAESAEEVVMRPGVTVHHVPAGPARPVPKDQLLPFMVEFGEQLARYWDRRRPDVVHSHFWMSGLASLRGARHLGIPVAHTYHALGTVKRRHQGSQDTSPAQRIALETHLGRTAARVIATCSDEVGELLAMGVPADRIRIVPCGVDPKRFSPQGDVAPRSARHRLLMVGRLVARKGGATALEALARLPDTELVIAGGPPADRLDTDPECRRLRALAVDHGVADRLVLLGGVPSTRMPALLRSADLVVCPAHYEPFGIVPLEAMACGVPVVATAVGGHLDTVADGRTGLLVPAGSGAALAAAAARLLGDPRLRRGFGAAGRRRVLAFYGWDRVAANTERIYQETVRPLPAALPPRARTGAPSGGL
ncbi:glycosyltransferase [Kitasatospora sp. A2-31]|uniref:glycosyltransferase n=1 Tax=Kitasatospora sp. A2-31 TaxID=2916414 RepID=UPI001EECDEF2|nr:glycosyltransferase [Kitasatospora sp. A2-31]MCG6497764.1 glycosyltransferase [Kitasatospora sp. A2-31]